MILNRIVIVCAALLCAVGVHAQKDIDTITDVKLEDLATPTNAAFVIMGTTPAEINKPSSVPEFVLSVQNASDNFSQFPNNFGVAFAPFWWTNGKQLSFEKEFDTNNRARLYRHLQVSIGAVSEAGGLDNNWRYALGLKTNLLEGKVDSEARDHYNKLLQGVSEQLNEAYSDLVASDNQLQNYYFKRGLLLAEKEALDKDHPFGQGLNVTEKAHYEALASLAELYSDSIETRSNELSKKTVEIDAAMQKALEDAFQKMKMRYGFKWDFGAAGAYDFFSNSLDSANFYRAGVWTNFGYSLKATEKCQWTFLGAVRYYYYDQVFYQLENSTVLIDNLGALDMGVRAVADANKFSFSIEGLYRIGTQDSYESTYKLNALANYRFGTNKSVFVSFGNDFNDASVGGPDQLRVYVGLNLGFGDSDFQIRLR